jgi:hypothetical protein
LEEFDESIDVIVHGCLIIFLESMKVEVCMDILDIKDLAVFILKPTPNCWGALLYCTYFKEFD